MKFKFLEKDKHEVDDAAVDFVEERMKKKSKTNIAFQSQNREWLISNSK